MSFLKKYFKYLFVLTLVFSSASVYASVSEGTIDATNNNALLCTNDSCSTYTRINFKTTLGNAIKITDTAITGNAWSETFGWINLNPTLGGVKNTSEGILSGYAWGDGAGWINFKPTLGGVTITKDGQFYGYAWSENYGWIKFDCANTSSCVSTDWRPLSARPKVGGTSGSSMAVVAPSAIVAPIGPAKEVPTYDKPTKIPSQNTNNNSSSNSNSSPSESNFINPQPKEAPKVYNPNQDNSSKKLTSNTPVQKKTLINKNIFKKANNSLIKVINSGQDIVTDIVSNVYTTIVKISSFFKSLFK